MDVFRNICKEYRSEAVNKGAMAEDAVNDAIAGRTALERTLHDVEAELAQMRLNRRPVFLIAPVARRAQELKVQLRGGNATVEKLDEEVKSWQRAKQHWSAVLARVACASA